MIGEDLAAIAEVLQRIQPDLAALQEVDRGTRRAEQRDVAAELGKQLGLHTVFSPAIRTSGGEYGNALLSRWPLTEAQHIALPDIPDRERRSMVIARVEIPDRQGGPLRLAGTHFDHNSGDTNRVLQARAVLKEVQRDGLPLLLGGDFNCSPKSPPFRILSGGMLDTRRDHPRPTWSSKQPQVNIDSILAYPGDAWRVVEVRTGDELFPEDPKWRDLLQRASDHLPVLVVLERKPTNAETSDGSERFRDGVADRVHDAR